MSAFDLWREKNELPRSYAHFDPPIKLSSILHWLLNPEQVCRHSFLPFIHFVANFNKFKHHAIKPKSRKLYYCSHKDRLVYSYYSFLLNQSYIKYIQSNNFSECVIAYRPDLHQSTPELSKRAFDFIKSQEQCVVYIGDFTNFFDTLDHKYLKRRICSVLGTNNLPNDWYKVFKNISNFNKVDVSTLCSVLKIPKLPKNGLIKATHHNMIMSLNRFKFCRKNIKNFIQPNKENYGIPQGSPISATLSNVYLTEFDQVLYWFSQVFHGLYLRYCDDFIIIIPGDITGLQHINKILSFLVRTDETLPSKSIPNLTLEQDKTQSFIIRSNKVYKIKGTFSLSPPTYLQFLGLSFDGTHVKIRDKTTSKYYYRMYRKAKAIVNCKKRGINVSARKLYELYSSKNSKAIYPKKGHFFDWNFLTYIQTVKKVFGNQFIDNITNRHLQKIRKRLKK